MGWRAAYWVLGGGCGLLSFCAAITVRLPRPAERRDLLHAAPGPAGGGPGGGMTLRQSLSDPRQWGLNLSWLLLGGLAIMISVHAVPFARDRGVSLADASLALTAYGIGSVAGRLTAGFVSDRVGTRATIGAAYVLEMIALVALLWLPSSAALLASLVVFGAGFAASDTMVVKVIPEVFGLRAIGAIMGVLALGWRLGAAIGPAAAGFLYDLTGSYSIPFGAAPVAVALSWVLFSLSTSPPRR
jgi:predicted MFS family arabinose efflux permease